MRREYGLTTNECSGKVSSRNWSSFLLTMEEYRIRNGREEKLVYCKYIHKNGKLVYPKKAKAFRLWIPVSQQ